jgi:hypothetical protein
MMRPSPLQVMILPCELMPQHEAGRLRPGNVDRTTLQSEDMVDDDAEEKLKKILFLNQGNL